MPIVKRTRTASKDPKQRSPWVKGQKKREKTLPRRVSNELRRAGNRWVGIFHTPKAMRHMNINLVVLHKRRAKNRMARRTRAMQRRTK